MNAATGILFLLIDSGHGECDLVDMVRRGLNRDSRFSFPRRAITGDAPAASAELHQSVTPAQFQDLRRTGAFSLIWGSGRRNFALPSSVDADLAAGRVVLAAAAPSAVAAACARWPQVVAVLTAEGEAEVPDILLGGCEEIVRLRAARPSAAAAELAGWLRDAVPTVLPQRGRHRIAGPSII